MLKSTYAKLNTAHGVAFPLVLLFTFLAVALLVAGLAPMITTQSRVVAHTEDQLIARYAAEAGVKRGLLLARNAYDNLPRGVPPSSIPERSKTHETFSDGISYDYSYKYIDGNTKQNPKRIEVTATATSGSTTANSMAWIVFESINIPGYKSPPFSDLVQSANSNNLDNCYHWESKSIKNYLPWSFGDVKIGGKTVKGAYPASGTSENIILFENDFNSAEFTLDYNISFEKEGSSGGVGIIYGASESDKASEFNAYCIKFNNDRNAFSVTKFISDNSAYKGTSYEGRPVELVLHHRDAGPNAGDTTTIAAFQPNGTEVNGKRVDSFNNEIGRCSIPYSEFTERMGIHPKGTSEFDIKIETKSELVDVKYPNGSINRETRLRHIISLKNNKTNEYEVLLNFIDFSDVNSHINTYAMATCKGETEKDIKQNWKVVNNPIINLVGRKADKNNPKKIRTGLRVWNVKACAFNTNDINNDDQDVFEITRIIWKQ
jgi:hypothetical protein